MICCLLAYCNKQNILFWYSGMSKRIEIGVILCGDICYWAEENVPYLTVENKQVPAERYQMFARRQFKSISQVFLILSASRHHWLLASLNY